MSKNSIKLIACFLSILMIVNTIPTIVFADSFDSLLNATVSIPADTDFILPTSQEESFEVTERREETVKHFRMEDGSYAAVQYNTPVHYLDQDGAWQDIDNHLSSSGNEYVNGQARIKFAKQIPGNEVLFTLHDGNRKITMSLNGATKKTIGQVTNTLTEHDEASTELQKMMTPDHLSSKILYPDILDGVDLEYVLDSLNVKENIIVKEMSSAYNAYNYSFTIKLNNLDATLTDDGNVVIADSATGETVYVMPAPVVYDAGGFCADSSLSSFSLVSCGNGTWTLNVSVDPTWMNDTARAYPVVIDPAIIPSVNGRITDTYVASSAPLTTYGTSSVLSVGTPSSGSEMMGFVKFNPLPTVPEQAYVTSAYFELYCTSRSGISLDGQKCCIFPANFAWTDALTWNALPEAEINHTDPLDGMVCYRRYSSITPQSYVRWDITGLYRDWVDYAVPNNGIQLKNLGEGDAVAVFGTSESTSNKPRLVLNYRDMKGIESYWSSSPHSAGAAGAGYVNHANGNLVFSIPLLNTGDALFGYTPSIVYQSALAEDYHSYTYNPNIHYKYSFTGYGAKVSTNESIVKRQYTNASGELKDFYIWNDSDGTEHYFLQDASNSAVYRDEDGLNLTLTMTWNHYYIEDAGHTIRQFTRDDAGSSTLYAGGILEHIQDKYGNKLRFNYNSYGQTTTVDVVPSGSNTPLLYLSFSYSSLLFLNQIENHLTGQGISIEYGYNYTGNECGTHYCGPIRKLHYMHKDGTQWITDATMSYGYTNCIGPTISSVYRLGSAKDESSGTEIRYEYDTRGRVSKVTEYGAGIVGQSIGYDYRKGVTWVRSCGHDGTLQNGTNSDDIITCYQLDYAGRAVGVYSTDASGQTIYGATFGDYTGADGSDVSLGYGNERSANSLKSSTVLNGVTANYLFNGGFSHSLAGWEISKAPSNAPTFTLATDNTTKNSYLKTTSVSTHRQATQYVNLPRGTYTLSAMCKSNVDAGVTVKLMAKSKNDSTRTFDAECLVASKQDRTGELATTPVVTFSVTNTSEVFEIFIVVQGTIGSNQYVSIDDVMLSNNIGASRYNAVEFGSFNDMVTDRNGTVQSLMEDYWVANEYEGIHFNGRGLYNQNALIIEGNLNESRSVEQTIPFANDTASLQKKRTFTVSGFAMGSHQISNEESYFGLEVLVTYVDQIDSDAYFIDFNKELTSWQFVSQTFTTRPGLTVESIIVFCTYAYQPGTARFDEISLIEETGGNTTALYSYNDLGLLEIEHTPAVTKYYEYTDTMQIETVYSSLGEGIRYIYNETTDDLQSTVSFTFDVTEFDLLEWLSGRTDRTEICSVDADAAFKTDYWINEYGFNTATQSYAVNGTVDDPRAIPGVRSIKSSNVYELSTTSLLFGRLKKQNDSSGYEVTHHYNSKGLLDYERYSDGNGLYYMYDALGRQTQVLPLFPGMTFALPNAESVSYSYNNELRLSTIATATTVYSFEYDEFGNTTSINIGEGAEAVPLATYDYLPKNGLLSSMTYGNGKTMSYSYDELDRVSEICYTVGEGTAQENHYYKYTYTATGAVYSVESSESDRIYRYTYDSNGKLIGHAEQGRLTASSGYLDLMQGFVQYDDEGRAIETHVYLPKTTPNGVDYDSIWSWATYDKLGDSGSEVITFYDTLACGYYHGFYTEFSYDSLYRATGKTVTTDAGLVNTVSYTFRDRNDVNATTVQPQTYQSTIRIGSDTAPVSSTYSQAITYDAVGNIRTVTDDSGRVTKYSYDDRGQLIREDNPYFNKSFVYTYDNGGNRTSKKTYAYTTGTLGTVTTTENHTYTGDRKNGTTYDAVGNPRSYNSYDLTWSGRQLVEMNRLFGQSVRTFRYNQDGIRTSKISDGVEHVYTLNGTQIVSEKWSNNLLVYLYDETGAPIGMQYRQDTYTADQWDTYYFEKDIQGNIIAVYSETGRKLGTYAYDAWGQFQTTLVSDTTSQERRVVSTLNPFRYRGYYYDVDTGLYYLQSRYYDPQMGRFINADGYLNANGDLMGFNMYAYCSNNPVMFVDPTGELFWEILFVIGILGLTFGLTGCEQLTPLSQEDQVIADNEYWGTTTYPTAEEALETGLKNMLADTQKNNVEYFAYVYGEDGEYYISTPRPGDIDSVKPKIDNAHYNTLRYLIHSHAISHDRPEDHAVSEADFSFFRETRDILSENKYRKVFQYEPVPMYVCDSDGRLFILPTNARNMDNAYLIPWEALP